jgi:hypothetical protein
MARKITDIQNDMITAIQADATLSGLNSTSSTAIWRLLTYIVAVCIWALENILDSAIADQTAFIKNVKIHSTTWYADYARKFQFGSTLPYGEVEYDNTALTPQQVEAQQIVKYCICVKTSGGLLVKIAGVTNGQLSPIDTNSELPAFQEYMFRISAAGDTLFYKNAPADSLVLDVVIYYDALVLDVLGKRLDGANDTPVPDAINAFLIGMDFNQKFVPTDLIDVLQQVEGVRVPGITMAKTNYGTTPYLNVPIDGVMPDSGYLRIINPTDLNITYAVWKQP